MNEESVSVPTSGVEVTGLETIASNLVNINVAVLGVAVCGLMIVGSNVVKNKCQSNRYDWLSNRLMADSIYSSFAIVVSRCWWYSIGTITPQYYFVNNAIERLWNPVRWLAFWF